MKNTLIIIFTLLIFSCGSESTQNSNPPQIEVPVNTIILSPEQIRVGGIAIANPEMMLMRRQLKVTGKIDVPPQNLVSISFPMGGFLKSSKLLPGMHVTKGEILAVMEDAQFISLQQDFLMARNKLQFLEKDFLRQKELNSSP